MFVLVTEALVLGPHSCPCAVPNAVGKAGQQAGKQASERRGSGDVVARLKLVTGIACGRGEPWPCDALHGTVSCRSDLQHKGSSNRCQQSGFWKMAV